MLFQTEHTGESSTPWTVWNALAIWAAAFFGSGVWIAVLAQIAGGSDQLSCSVYWLFAGQLALWGFYGLSPLIIARWQDASVSDTLALAFRPRDVPIWAVVGLASQLILIPLVYIPLAPLIDTDSVGEVAEDLIGGANTVPEVALLFLMIVVIAPVVEELFFRGVVLTPLRNLGDWVAVAISSVWFAASHLQLVQFPGLLVVGAVLAICRIRTNSIVPPIALHMAFNGVTFGVLVSQLNLS